MGDLTRWRFLIQQRDGRLFVQTSRSEIMYEGWPTLKAWYRRSSADDWTPFIPYIDLRTGMVAPWAFQDVGWPLDYIRRRLMGRKPLSPFWLGIMEDLEPVRRFFSNVPQDVSALVTPFFYRQWQLLEFLKFGGEPAVELIRCNRGLAFSLALHRLLLPSPLSQSDLEGLFQDGPLAICRALGFPVNATSARVLSELPHQFCSPKIIRRLRTWLRECSTGNASWETPAMNSAIWVVLSSPYHRQVGRKLLEELSSPSSCGVSDIGVLLQRSCTLYKILHGELPPADALESVVALEKFAAQVKEERKQREREACLRLVFPRPILSGDHRVAPLTTGQELVEFLGAWDEIFMEAEAVARGEASFYRLTEPERAVVRVQRTATSVKVTEVLGEQGRPVSQEALEVVQAWFEAANFLI